METLIFSDVSNNIGLLPTQKNRALLWFKLDRTGTESEILQDIKIFVPHTALLYLYIKEQIEINSFISFFDRQIIAWAAEYDLTVDEIYKLLQILTNHGAEIQKDNNNVYYLTAPYLDEHLKNWKDLTGNQYAKITGKSCTECRSFNSCKKKNCLSCNCNADLCDKYHKEKDENKINQNKQDLNSVPVESGIIIDTPQESNSSSNKKMSLDEREARIRRDLQQIDVNIRSKWYKVILEQTEEFIDKCFQIYYDIKRPYKTPGLFINILKNQITYTEKKKAKKKLKKDLSLQNFPIYSSITRQDSLLYDIKQIIESNNQIRIDPEQVFNVVKDWKIETGGSLSDFINKSFVTVRNHLKDKDEMKDKDFEFFNRLGTAPDLWRDNLEIWTDYNLLKQVEQVNEIIYKNRWKT